MTETPPVPFEGPATRVGIVGSGFVSRHFQYAMERRDDLQPGPVLTRRSIDTCAEYPRADLLTNSVEQLLGGSDLVLECSGDPIHATDVIDAALTAGLPVVTMNAEFHVTAGSYFAGRGLLTEAEGDQPGCLAALHENAVSMGFEPLVYGNMKGFLNHNPTPEEMQYWGEKQGMSMHLVISATDGTKIQIEQALVANGLGATIAQPGMLGLELSDLNLGAAKLASAARALGQPISDYLLSSELSRGVFIVAEADERQHDALASFKLGDGPLYTLIKPNIFVHLEIAKTIRRVVDTGRPLLENSANPRVGVATIAKHKLEVGARIEQGMGSFDVRGSSVHIREAAGHVPIGLMSQAVLTRSVDAGQMLTFDDVELPESLALRAWKEVERRVLASEPGSS